MRATSISAALALVLGATAAAAWPALAQDQHQEREESIGPHRGQDQRNGAKADMIGTGEDDADVTAARPDQEGGADLGGSETQGAAVTALGHHRAEEAIGKPLVNAAGEEIGRIEDLVRDKNQAVHAVVGVGGFLGVGERKVAIPFDQLQFSADEARITTSMSAEALKALPDYDPEQYEPMKREQTIGD